jgi:hypothetical protein
MFQVKAATSLALVERPSTAPLRGSARDAFDRGATLRGDRGCSIAAWFM